MAAEVLYTRVPSELKAAVEAYAQERAQTTSTCVAELLSLGFEAATKTRTVARLTARIGDLEEQLAAETAFRHEAEQRNEAFRGAAASWRARAQNKVGTCQECKRPVLGSDVLISGTCGHCGASLGPVVDRSSGLSERDWYLLAGAAGLVLGMLLTGASK